MFITFEGIDGSGKSTQLELLAEALKAEGKPVVVTREPGGSELGQTLRQILLHHPGFISSRCELFLYLADRAQHVETLIRPALAENKIVLCDRFIDSTVAYQGLGRRLSVEEIQRMNAMATGGLQPDKTILLDAPVEVLLHRAKNRSEADRLEQETVDFYANVRQQYLTLAHAEPDRFLVLDATLPIEEIQKSLLLCLPIIGCR